MIRKRKGKDGVSFYVYVKGSNGKRRYVGAFGSMKEATQAEQEHAVTQRKIASGELPAEVDLDRTFGDAAREWLKSLEARASRSHEGYTTRMTIYILPTFRDVPLAKLNKAHVMRWRDEQSTRLAPATVNGSLTCLSSAFTYFVDSQWLEKNPCHGVERIESPDAIYRWIQTREEITKLLLHCHGELRDIVAVALATGMRLDEILHLQWADVEIDRRLIAVHRGRQGTVKSGKARRIPILDTILSLLRERAIKRGGAELVFPGKSKITKGTIASNVRSKPGVQGAYKRALRQAGLDPLLRFHDLRHSFASHWVLDGGDIFRLSKILGHSSVALTQKVYAHLSPDAWEQDYKRVAFVVPRDAAVYKFERDETSGRLSDRRLVPAAG